MSNYRRFYIPGACYFFTVVTEARRPLFNDEEVRLWLRQSIRAVRRELPFRIDAICLLPDHLHCLWTLPLDDGDYSRRWQRIKAGVSKEFVRSGKRVEQARPSRAKKGEVEVWQRRFWDHCIRNEDDYRRHFDYIHYNPVRHGLVRRLSDWPWSSFARYVRMGWYTEEWGSAEPKHIRGLETGEIE